MQSLRIIFTILIIYSLITNTFSQNRNDTIVYWNKNIKLSWRDFHGDVPDSGRNTANTNYEVNCSFISCFDFKAIVYFNRLYSWTKDTTSKDLLDHEQYHFNLAEIGGRKVRKYFQKYCDGELDELDFKEVDKILHENDALQNRYDNETKHGINKIMQKKWNEIIRKELEKLKEFEVNYEEYLEE